MFNLSAKKSYLINSFTGFENTYNTKIVSVEVEGNNLILDIRVNPSFVDFESLADRIYTTVTYNVSTGYFTIKCEGKGSRKYNSTVKREVTDIIKYLATEADKAYKSDCTDARHMTAVYYYNVLSKFTNDTFTLNELDYKVCHEELSVSELHEYVTNKAIELQPKQVEVTSNVQLNDTNNTETTFTVGNISFSSYEKAEVYCISSDFDTTMIIKGVDTMQPSHVITDTPITTGTIQPEQIALYNYKDIFYFNSYDVSKLTEKAWNADINKHNAMYYKLKELPIMDAEHLTKLLNNNYSFYIQIANNNPYKQPNMYMIDCTLLYINKPFTIYINKDTLEKFIRLNEHTSSKALQAV